MEGTYEMSDIVKITYKTGEYVGEVIEHDERRLLVKVLAVLQHPMQGDIHNPYDPDVAMFHERRALSYTEKVWVPIKTAEPYTGAILDYRETLLRALGIETERVDRLKRWGERSLEQLETLRKDYGV